MQVEKTYPEEIRTKDILEFNINVKERTIDVHLENGACGTVNKPIFLNFWNNIMTQNQRNIVRGFVKQLSALAMDVNQNKVTGELMD